MGYGDYSREAHEAITASRSALPAQAVFKQSSCHPLMNPHGVIARESRDSPGHPSSLAIAFALDVTGSMGDIPELLAKRELPHFMRVLTACGVADPQVLFLALGDAASDRSSLQVGQFETTAELMDQWLTYCHIERGGGAGDQESYELALYFLAEHTDLDCYRRRKKRGYVFMTGDERPYPYVSKHQVDALIGDRLDADLPTADVVAALRETYHPFFLVPDLDRRKRCEGAWRELLGDHVLCMESPSDTCHVAAGALALTEGLVRDLDELARKLEADGAARERIGAVVRTLSSYAALLDRDGGALASTPTTSLVSGRPARVKRTDFSE